VSPSSCGEGLADVAKERELEEKEDRLEATIGFDDLRLKREGMAVVSVMPACDHIVSNALKDSAALEVEHCVPEAILAILKVMFEISFRNMFTKYGH
jgi:hypothetical protein